MGITRAQGYVSWVGMSANVGEAWQWPPREDGARGWAATDHRIRSLKVGSSGLHGVSARVAMSVCGGVCSGYAAD
jgi:hypothetical protein